MTERPSALDDPDYAAFAWSRYRRLLGWMALVAVIAAGGGVAILWWQVGPLPIHVMIATALGIGFTILMAAALMGLVFLSSGTGHDEAVDHADLGEDARVWRED
jgi:hypothetical protein